MTKLTFLPNIALKYNNKKQPINKNSNMKKTFPLHYGLTRTGLPLIVVNIFNHNLCLLIDTGSTQNLLDKRVYEYFKENITVCSNSELIGIDGIKQSAERVNLNFSFEGTEYSSQFTIFDTTLAFHQIEKDSDIKIHGILGNEFLLENEWVIDYEKLHIQYTSF